MKETTIRNLTIGVFCVVAIFICYGCHSCFQHVASHSEKERRETHRAWQQLNPETPIPFEDWKRLKQDYLLPGQQRPNY